MEVDGKKVLIVHFADLVKFVCKEFFNWDGQKDEKGRSLLQYVGTDKVRAKFPDYWVDFIINMLDVFGENWDWVIIPDTRFPNEIEKMRQKNIDVIHMRVFRDNFDSGLTAEQAKHASETALDDSSPDIFINNRGDLEFLRGLIADAYSAIKIHI
jgi:hypothetical protein